jgi:hypothetical protein
MNYRKFDAPSININDRRFEINDAFRSTPTRRSLQGIANRVIGGSNGTQGQLITAGLADGSTGGVQIVNALTVIINGVQSSVIAQNNLRMPSGTMGTNTLAKFLVCTGTGTSGTVIGPGNVVDKGVFLSAADAATNASGAKLPDLPDGYCALGYLTLNAPAATVVTFNAGALGGTNGTSTYQDLNCMPYNY